MTNAAPAGAAFREGHGAANHTINGDGNTGRILPEQRGDYIVG